MAPAAEFIDAILEADRKAPRKQRHTATRIWHRIRDEVPGCTAAERTVRLYVEQRKEALGLGGARSSYRRATTGALKHRSIGMKPMPIWMANG